MSISLANTSIIALSTLINCNIGDICSGEMSAADWMKEGINNITVQQEVEFNPLDEARYLRVPEEVLLGVPFTSQAPHKNWVLPYTEACEEASLIMAEYFFRNQGLDAETADYEINQLLEYEAEEGWGVDIGVAEVAQMAREKYGRQTKIHKSADVTIYNIEHLLAAGYPIIVPAAGRELDNPNYIGDGPAYHMVVLIGYNGEYFYAHDPGTQFGAVYPYEKNSFMNAIHDWTGGRSTITEGQKAILVIE
jgi:hypothetical protein